MGTRIKENTQCFPNKITPKALKLITKCDLSSKPEGRGGVTDTSRQRRGQGSKQQGGPQEGGCTAWSWCEYQGAALPERADLGSLWRTWASRQDEDHSARQPTTPPWQDPRQPLSFSARSLSGASQPPNLWEQRCQLPFSTSNEVLKA